MTRLNHTAAGTSARMPKVTRIVSILFLMLSLSACNALDKQKSEILKALIIENHTSVPLTQVRLTIPKTHGLIECGYIPPNHNCSLGFPEVKNKHNPAHLSWLQNGQPYSQDLSNGGRLKEITDHPVSIVIKILENGNFRIEKQ